MMHKNFRPERFGKANFNPSELRDFRGWWSATNDGDAKPIPTGYNGRFHDVVVDDFLDGLKKDGSAVFKNIWIVGVNGFSAIPDGLSKPANGAKPYFLEAAILDLRLISLLSTPSYVSAVMSLRLTNVSPR